jgi:UDP-2,3-diacylglucosamine pyrophosphatase LpxH
MSETKRKLKLAVISDTHLGTYGCHAKELLAYLKSIDPETLVLNGDIIDIWQFNKRYWPKSHMKVIKHLVSLISKGKKVYYITGNHDELLRKFSGFELGSFKILDKLVLKLDGKKAWIFHGDVFDVTMQHTKWIAKLGAVGYDSLIILNRFVNWMLSSVLKREKISLSKRIKNSVKSAVMFINNFEQTAIDIAASKNYDFVICGHIHQPTIRNVNSENIELTYLNSGDWIENLSALEYNNKTWNIIRFDELDIKKPKPEETTDQEDPTTKELFNNLLENFQQSA